MGRRFCGARCEKYKIDVYICCVKNRPCKEGCGVVAGEAIVLVRVGVDRVDPAMFMIRPSRWLHTTPSLAPQKTLFCTNDLSGYHDALSTNTEPYCMPI